MTRRMTLTRASGVGLACMGLPAAVAPSTACAGSFWQRLFAPGPDPRDIANMPLLPAPLALPSTAFLDGQGRAVALAARPGRPYLLHLWAIWCRPCLGELPDIDTTMRLIGASRDHASTASPAGAVGAASSTPGDTPLIVPVASRSGDSDAVHEFFRMQDIRTLPVFADPGGRLLRSLVHNDHLGNFLPTTVLVGSAGQIVAAHHGAMSWSVDGLHALLRRAGA